MDAPRWKVAIGGLVFALLIAAVSLAGLVAANHQDFVAMLLASPFVGAWIVLSIVQAINRRDDPRHAKRPPDPP